eukprot:5183218-Pyramimonas_sp.AAC.1
MCDNCHAVTDSTRRASTSGWPGRGSCASLLALCCLTLLSVGRSSSEAPSLLDSVTGTILRARLR